MNIGNWTDEPCWYASIQDNGRTALLLGPFRTEDECRKYAYSSEEHGGNTKLHSEMLNYATEVDQKAWWYSYGMVKMKTGHRNGCLNKFYPNI